MNWKQKARLAKLFDTIPFGNNLHYFIQRNVTKSLPRKAKHEYFDIFYWHLRNVDQHLGGTSNIRLFEFGAGWDLFYNIWFHAYGIKHQTVVDLNPYLKPDLVDFEVRRLRTMKPDGAEHIHEGSILSKKDVSELGIEYLAPCDARATGFEPNSYDLVVSTNTMEHIPHVDLALILKEAYRLLKPGGIISSKIDYADHYYYVDKTITPYNYMLFDGDEWKRYNSDGHFQNRGRHSDYVKLFTDAGFKLLENRAVDEYPGVMPPDKEYRAEDFGNLSDEDLLSTAGYFCAVKET